MKFTKDRGIITTKQTDTHTDKQTDTHTDKQTDTHTDKQTDTHTDKQTDTHTDKQMVQWQVNKETLTLSLDLSHRAGVGRNTTFSRRGDADSRIIERLETLEKIFSLIHVQSGYSLGNVWVFL